MMVHTFNYSIQEMDAGGLTVQGYLWLHGKFGTSLRYMSYLSQNNNSLKKFYLILFLVGQGYRFGSHSQGWS